MDLEAEIVRLQQQVAELAAKAQAAEDYIAVSNLQRSYGYYVDRAQWDQAADLFAREATLEINGRGVFVGQDRVRAYMHRFGPPKHGQLFNHMQLQPVIHVAPDGMTAKARLRAIIQVGQLGESAMWGEGTYENEYVREDGVWKIARLHFYQIFYAGYDGGWHKDPLPLIGPYPDFPPDRPPSEDYKVFPEFAVPPYHYRNPVSAR